MCDSLPSLDEFNFNDINLDFLDSPPRPKHANPTTKNPSSETVPCSSNLSNEEQVIREPHPKVQRNSIQDVAKRIADVDKLICQYREVEKERDVLRKQLNELNQSAKEVQTMYAKEKQKLMEEQAKSDGLFKKSQNLDMELMTRSFELDQLKAKLEGLKAPIKYDELAIRYLKLVQRLDEDRSVQKGEQAFVREVQKYCKVKGLKFTPCQQRSPKNTKVPVSKLDAEVQCNLEAADTKIAIQTESRDNSTQCERPKTRNQGCQYIGTTTTRSTTTSCFIKYHDVGISCNLLDFSGALNEILDDMRSWSNPVAPLSPIADLVDNWTRTDAAILPPPPPPPPPVAPVEVKNTGTCTYICNVQRSVDYVTQLPTIKRSISRPPSTLMYEPVKDESIACSTTAGTTTINPLDGLNNRFTAGSAPTLYSTAFNELWQIFGHMLYGLLQRRGDNSSSFGQPIPENNVTNQQEFYNWLQTLYLGMNTSERGQTHNQNQDQELQDIQNTRNTQENIGCRTETESTTERTQQQQNQSFIESPLNFSNETPVKDKTSEQYLFKPKAQKSGNYSTEENPIPQKIDRQSDGTSPVRCMISSPIRAETKASKSTAIENLDIKSTQNRTPSAFTSPKSMNHESDCTNKVDEKSEHGLSLKNNDRDNLQSFPKMPKMDENRKGSSPRNSMENSIFKSSPSKNSNNEVETAVDFLAKLEAFNDSIKACKDEIKEELESQMNTSLFSNTTVKNLKRSEKYKPKVRKLDHSLFGSETDDTDYDSSDESEITEPRSGIDSSSHSSSFSSESDVSSDGSDKVNLVKVSNKCQLRPPKIEVEQRQKSKNRRGWGKVQRNTSVNCCRPSKRKKTCSPLGTLSETSESENDDKKLSAEPQKTTDDSAEARNGSKVNSSLMENQQSTSESDDTDEEMHVEPQGPLDKEGHSMNGGKYGVGIDIQVPNELDKLKSVKVNSEKDESSKISPTKTPHFSSGNGKKSFEKALTEKETSQEKNIVQKNLPMEACLRDSTATKNERYADESLKAEKYFEVVPLNSQKRDDTYAFHKYESSSSSSSETDSTSSVESKLLIVSDVEEETTSTKPKKRGRKRKSESSSPNGSNAMPTVYSPCKRSARLLAKQKMGVPNFCYLLNGRKNTRRSRREDKKLCEETLLKSLFEPTTKEESNPLIASSDESSHEDISREELEDFFSLISKAQPCEPSPKDRRLTVTSPSASPVTSPEEKNSLITKVVESNREDIANEKLESPASPAPLENQAIIDSQSESVKQIPLQRIEECCSWRGKKSLLPKLISNYEAKVYLSLKAEQKFKTDEKLLLDAMESHLNDYLSLKIHTEDAAVQLVNNILSTSQDSKLISHAICSSSQKLERPPTTQYEHFKNTQTIATLDRPIPSNINQLMPNVLSHLIRKLPNLSHTLPAVIESILFNVQSADTLAVEAALNLTEVFLIPLSLPDATATQAVSNPARLFIAKCLYYHKVKAMPMIHIVLSKFPTTLPHREEHNYDRSDALITVIQHVLMCFSYDMEKHDLFHRELLSKLRFAYHFEVYKPTFQDVLQNLVEKLRAGKLNNLQYAFAIFCKQLPPDRVVRDIIQAHMIPLSQEYYTLVQQTTEYDDRVAALLDSFSFVVKPFPRDKSLSVEIDNYLNIFKRFLAIVERPIVQEAAVHAILRLQRFSVINCFKALIGFRPDYELRPHTRAALRTFIHRSPFNFWKTLLSQSG